MKRSVKFFILLILLLAIYPSTSSGNKWGNFSSSPFTKVRNISHSLFSKAESISTSPFSKGGYRGIIKTDQVIIETKYFSSLFTKEIEKIRLLSFKNDKLGAIPYQIDQKDLNGNYILQYDDEGLENKDLRKTLTGLDELVFMYFDSGEKVKNKARFKNFKNVYEIEIVDATTRNSKFTYLIYGDKDYPQESQVDYVVYNAKSDEIDAYAYKAKFPKEAPISLDTLSIKENCGGNNIDYLDRLKIRIRLTTFFNYVIEKDERDFKIKLLGYNDGKIRVIRRVKDTLMLFSQIPLLSALSENIFYSHHFSIPVVFNLPIPLDIFFNSGELKISSDGAIPDSNRKFFNLRNPKGAIFDGIMDEYEKNLDYGKHDWQVVAGPPHAKGSWLNRIKINPAEVGLPYLHYGDDINSPDPPEEFMGQAGNVGYILKNFYKLKKGHYDITSYMYAMPDYKFGDEKEYLNILDNPLKTKVELIK